MIQVEHIHLRDACYKHGLDFTDKTRDTLVGISKVMRPHWSKDPEEFTVEIVAAVASLPYVTRDIDKFPLLETVRGFNLHDIACGFRDIFKEVSLSFTERELIWLTIRYAWELNTQSLIKTQILPSPKE